MSDPRLPAHVPPAGGNRPPVVLIIEDEPGDAALIRWQLLERDEQAFVIHQVSSLAEAKALLDAGELEPDVVLLDLNLPDSSGPQSVERAHLLTDAPIVVLTGLDDASATQAAIQSGAEDYLAKGGEGSGLRRAVRYAMLRHRRDADARLAATVFSHAREGVVITDPQGTIVDVNRSFTLITGYPRDEVIGQNPRILKSGRHPQEFYQDLWQELLDKGHWYGELWNRRKNGQEYAVMLTISAVRNARGRLSHLVGLCSDITLQKEHEQQLRHIAHYDSLTGLPNRVLLTDRLNQAMLRAQRTTQPLVLAYIDLDGFKAINDSHGHDVGDQLLSAIGQRMRHALRDSDTIARLGGDEFVAVVGDLAEPTQHLSLIQRLLAAISQPVPLEGLNLQLSASIGLSFFPQEEAVEADQLLRQADQAMYQAKLAGKNRYHIFDAERDRSVRGHHQGVGRIEQALQQQEFLLHYQPKVNMRTGEVIGVEALIRWQDPKRGVLEPDQFLPLLDQHPMSIRLDRWVLDQAIIQAGIWQAQGLKLPVCVNIAPLYLQQPDFVAQLRGLLSRHPETSPTLLRLEVLETSALADMVHVSEVIRACAAIGVGFALDDFGTGYSSLTYLKRLPADELKIDQTFVRDMLHDPDDLAILEGVLGLAAAFRRQAVAEGVETIAHGVMLLQLGCELGQGYGIARPMAAAAISPWIDSWRPDPLWVQTRKIPHEALPVLHASVEHRAWIHNLEAFLNGQRDTPPQLDPHQCRFGRWLDTLDQHNLPHLSQLCALHHQAHQLADILITAHRQGQPTAARAQLAELHQLRDQLLQQLPELLHTPPLPG